MIRNAFGDFIVLNLAEMNDVLTVCRAQSVVQDFDNFYFL